MHYNRIFIFIFKQRSTIVKTVPILVVRASKFEILHTKNLLNLCFCSFSTKRFPHNNASNISVTCLVIYCCLYNQINSAASQITLSALNWIHKYTFSLVMTMSCFCGMVNWLKVFTPFFTFSLLLCNWFLITWTQCCSPWSYIVVIITDSLFFIDPFFNFLQIFISMNYCLQLLYFCCINWSVIRCSIYQFNQMIVNYLWKVY